MGLSSRSLGVSPAQLPRTPYFLYSTKPCCRLVKRLHANSFRPSASSTSENKATENGVLSKDPDRASWLQPSAISDPFFGWTSDNPQQDHKTKAGWKTLAGIGILAVGLALGMEAYHSTQANKSSAAIVPATQGRFSSEQKKSQSIEITDKMDENKDSRKDNVDLDMQPQENSLAVVTKPEEKVLISAPVDRMQKQYMAALQALKVIETDAKAGDICRRRDYARWLIVASAILSRSPAHTVFPAMYIEGITQKAYADVIPEDKDFMYIQGLAEAGLIYSRLLREKKEEIKNDSSFFKPDSPVTRQDLVMWKISLERNRPLPLANSCLSAKKGLEELSGFVDINKMRAEACPALLADIRAGERGITALAFGYTRRFQPEKPVTKVQAAVALATGEAWELVSEELARLEAESIAEAAVATELALETNARREVAAAFHALLEAEKSKQIEAACLIENLENQLQKVNAQYEEEKYALLKVRAELDCEKTLLQEMKRDLQQQTLDVSSARLDLSFQRERVDKLRVEADKEKEKISKIRAELEVERSALSLARDWAEEEARRALAHSNLLQKTRQRWEHGGVQVRVHKELEDVNIPGPNWRYSNGNHGQTSPMGRILETSNHLMQQLKKLLVRFVELVVLFCHSLQHRLTGFAEGFGEKFGEVKTRFSETVASILANIEHPQPSITRLTTLARESSLKFFAQCKGGAERLVEKIKVS